MEQNSAVRVPPQIEELQKLPDTPPIEPRELFLKKSSFTHQILDNTTQMWEFFWIDSAPLKKKAEIINYITEFLTANFIWKSLVDKKKFQDLYIFNNTTKYYDFVSKAQFCGEIDELFQGFPVLMGKYNTRNGAEIYERIVNRNITRDETLDYYPNLLPFLNGVYNFETYEFKPNTPDHFITLTLPYDRDESLGCDLFKKTMEEILPDPISRRIVLTYLSYCLSGSIKLELAHIWMGKKNNGKTKLCEFFVELLGDLGSSVAFESLAGDAGAICRTRGKRVNGAGEIGGDYLNKSAVDRAKRLITDKLMEGRDAYERHQKWKNQCKQIFPTNDLPNPRKCKMAFYRRWQIIMFLVDFTGKEDRTVFDRIYEQEAAGVISYLLTFVPDWEKILVTNEDEIMEIWKNDALSTYKFIEEMCEIDGTSKVETQELYAMYGNWCLEQGKDAVAMKVFGSDLRQEGVYWTQLRDSNITSGDNRVSYYVGITLKETTFKESKAKQENLAEYCEEVVKFTPKKSEVTETQTRKILEQLTALHNEYGKTVSFSEDDIFEPLYTWMDKDEFRMAITALSQMKELQVTEFGIRLK